MFLSRASPTKSALSQALACTTALTNGTSVVKFKKMPRGKMLKIRETEVQYISNGEAKRVVYAEKELEINE